MVLTLDSGIGEIVGDSIYGGKEAVEFEPLPQFTPKLFMEVVKTMMKQKYFLKGSNNWFKKRSSSCTRLITNDYVLESVGCVILPLMP